ncbi:zinc-binding metallopeptidase family protein [Fusibacter tunisiensis]|uniref:Uncharacterized protein n=1 Tax=Fusibacter tunisiensis TaxID=1008308 RepID=A0ABS2MR20_9FIRM|nr:hypothetical protein [Fusibacter tunisiensis]MBM7561863.1 hypothetical protein [Fusibacter tunisiensis]
MTEYKTRAYNNYSEMLKSMAESQIQYTFTDNGKDETVILYAQLKTWDRYALDIFETVLKEPSVFDYNLLCVIDGGMSPSIEGIKEIVSRLDATVAILLTCVPQEMADPDIYTLFDSTLGNIKPYIFVRGTHAHPDIPFSGLGTIGILSEIIKAIELNTEMSDLDQGHMVAPPRFISQKYAQTDGLPQYGVAMFNWSFMDGDLGRKFGQLKSLCEWSFEDAINQYNYAFNEFLRKQKKPSYECCQDFDVTVKYAPNILFPSHNSLDYGDYLLENASEITGPFSTDKPFVAIGLLPELVPPSIETFENKSKLEAFYDKVQEGNQHINRKRWSNISVPASQMGYPHINLGPGYLESYERVVEEHVKTRIPNLIIRMLKANE